MIRLEGDSGSGLPDERNPDPSARPVDQRRGLPRPSAEAQAAVARLAAPLLERTDQLTNRLISMIVASDEVYRRRGLVPFDELWQGCHDSLTEVLQGLSHTGQHRPPRRARAVATGHRRAEQGVPLENVLHAYRLGGRLIWHALLEEARGCGAGTEELLAEAATLVWEGTDLYSAAVVASYRRTEAETISRDHTRRQHLLHQLLTGSGATAERDRAVEALGLAPGDSLMVAVADGPSNANLSGSLESAGLRSEWAVLQANLAGLISCPPPRQPSARQVLASVPGARVGLSAPFTSPDGAPSAYRQAELALRSIPPGRCEVAQLDDHLTGALLASSPELARRLVQRTLGALLALEATESRLLLSTLRAYFDQGGSVARTASAIPCHRNTVCNRLARIESLTGLAVSEPSQLATLVLACEAARLVPAGAETESPVRELTA